MSDEKEQKPQRKAGRPSKYETEFCDRVRELGTEGLSRFQIAARLGVSKGTLYNWEESHPEFKEAMGEAEDLAQAWWEDVGQAGLDRRDFNSQAFAFQMKNRFKGYREVQTHQLTGPDGMPLTAEQPSSGELAKALMFLFGEGAVVLPKSDQTYEIDGPELNGTLPMIGNGSAPAVPTTEELGAPPALPSADAAEAQPEHSATSETNSKGFAHNQSETFDNGASIVFDATHRKFACFDPRDEFHVWRREYSAAVEFAKSLK